MSSLSQIMERMRATSRGPGLFTGSPRKLATGRGELPATSESSAQALCTQVGSLWEGGTSFCPGADAEELISLAPRTTGLWATAHCPDGKTEASGLAQGHPVSGYKALTPHLLKSEITVTAGAAICPALPLPQAPWGLLWPRAQFLGVGPIIPI